MGGDIGHGRFVRLRVAGFLASANLASIGRPHLWAAMGEVKWAAVGAVMIDVVHVGRDCQDRNREREKSNGGSVW